MRYKWKMLNQCSVKQIENNLNFFCYEREQLKTEIFIIENLSRNKFFVII